MPQRANVMVFVEQQEGRIADVSLELIGEAGRLAGVLGVQVDGVAAGFGLASQLEGLGRFGCRRVYYLDHPGLQRYTTIPAAKVVVAAIRQSRPQIVLFGATTIGRDLAPRVASTLRCGLTADCTDLRIGEYRIKDKVFAQTLLQIRPAFGGNIVATIVSPESFPSMATVREGVMKMGIENPGQSARLICLDLTLEPADFPTTVIEVLHEEKCVDLKSARIIVSAGMGAADPGSLALVKKLAKVLGAVVGSSRPVVDACVLPKDHQVGQTGTTVRPNLYIACGISGQIQHRAGMCESKRIIAINKDPNAPIFDIAHYGIVGDVKDVIPRMIKAYQGQQ
jgi:electron transfer flavoprotein alpha subunit